MAGGGASCKCWAGDAGGLGALRVGASVLPALREDASRLDALRIDASAVPRTGCICWASPALRMAGTAGGGGASIAGGVGASVT